MKTEIRRYLEQNEIKIQYQNLWNVAKAALMGRFLALNGYIKKRKV